MTKEEKIQFKIDNYIQEFKEGFIKKFNIIPEVTYEGYKPLVKLNLGELEECCNIVLEKIKSPEDDFSQGLRTKSRRRNLVTVRQCYYKLARDMGYSFETIGGFLSFDHATVVHGVNTVNNYREQGVEQVVLIMNMIKDEIAKLLRDDGDVQHDSPKEHYTQSVLLTAQH